MELYLESQSYTNYSINYCFYSKSTLQSSSLIIQTTHFEEIKAKRSVLLMKQIGHKIERNCRASHAREREHKNSSFLSKINIASIHIQISTTNFQHQNKLGYKVEKITERATARLELYLES